MLAMLRTFDWNKTTLCLFVSLLAFAIAATCGCGGSAESGATLKRIIILTNGDDPFWDGARVGGHEAEAELNLKEQGFSVVQHRGDFTVETQINLLNQYATETDVAALAVSIIEPDNKQLIAALRGLQDRGVPIVTIDSDVDREKYVDIRFAHLGTDNRVGGRQIGKAMQVLKPEGGTYTTFVGNKSQANSIARIDGVAEGAGESFESVGDYTDGGDEQVAQDRVRTALDNFPEQVAMVGIWAYNAHPIVKLTTERGLRDKMALMTFDARAIALDHMEEGNLDFMVVQNPFQMGELSVKILKALLDDDHDSIETLLPDYDAASKSFRSPDGDVFSTELRAVVPNEDSPLTEEIFEEGVRFYYLKDFRQWMAERNLTDS